MGLAVRVRAKGLVLCLLYMVVGPTLMLLNKEILSGEINFRYPLLLSSLGLITAATVAHGGALLGFIHPRQQAKMTRPFLLKNILPVGVCHACTLAAGNAQYLYMGVAMVQFLKAFTPGVVAVVGLGLLGRTESTSVWVSLLSLCLATSLTAAGENNASLFGFGLAATSSLCEAIRLILTQYLVQDMKFTLWESQYYLAPCGGIALLLAGLYFEGEDCMDAGGFRKVAEYPGQFAAASSLGLCVQLLTPAVIKEVGSVTLKALSQVRNAGVVMAGVIMYHETINSQQQMGYLGSLVAFGFYTYYKTTSGVSSTRGTAASSFGATSSELPRPATATGGGGGSSTRVI